MRAQELSVSFRRFSVDRQYDLESASLEVDGKAVAVVPHWWIPKSCGSFMLRAPIVPSGEAPDAFVRLNLPFDRGAYLTEAHHQALATAFARRAAAVLLTIEHESGEIYTYNVDQHQEPWPVPVILVAAKDKALLDGAERAGRSVTVTVSGRYRHDVPGRNVIGRLDRGKKRTIVVSTPVTSWFTSTCERGPGIAGFLAMARFAARRLVDADLVFVATAGHEIGHGGMAHFLRTEAPAPAGTAAWAHFGASLACYRWRHGSDGWTAADAIDARTRVIARSTAMDALVARHFAAIEGTALVGNDAAIGELRDVHAAGYPNFFGMAGLHGLFHTPADNAAGTGPAILEPVARAFADVLTEIARTR